MNTNLAHNKTYLPRSLQDTLNVWYKAKLYHIRYNGRIKTFSSYLDAKDYIDSIMQTVFFHGEI